MQRLIQDLKSGDFKKNISALRAGGLLTQTV